MPATTPLAQQKAAQKKYEDVSPLTSDADSDFEDDPVVRAACKSAEIAEHDRELLDEEDEREKLLLLTAGSTRDTSRGFFDRGRKDAQYGNLDKTGKSRVYKSRKRRRKTKGSSHDEEGKLMYEMEEGGPKSETSSQASSSSVQLDKMNLEHSSTRKRRKLALWHMIAIAIATLFALLTFGAYKVSRSTKSSADVNLRSNGTALFAPTTILISLDGFRADFLLRGITPTLCQFIAEGVSPNYMHPSFPSVTFPNHYTLVTGLYPESHGIVGNTFWAPELSDEFHTGKGSMEKKWWTEAEPIWATAEKQNVKTAIHMWPGSEASTEFSASFVDKFNMTEVLPRKTERILELLDLPGHEEDPVSSQRPQLIAAYVPVVDSDGHTFGPNSTEIWNTISDVDSMLHHLFKGLDERNLTGLVNVVVVSDHGMATTSTDRCIQIDDLIDLDLVEHIDGWPLYGLRPKNPIDIRGLYDRLLVESQSSGNFDVYLRDENMPARYHFSNNDRIAPLWVVPKTGYAIVHKEDFDVKAAKAKGEAYHPKGLHGYDHEHPLMRAIFVARGPAFPHKPNSRLEAFQNIEVYNIICDSIGIEPKANNGTLRLPLRPAGLHSDNPSSAEDHTIDFSPDENLPEAPEAINISEGKLTVTEQDKAKQEQTETKAEMNKFLAYVKAKMAAAQAWANKVIATLKSNQEDPEKGGGSFEQGDTPA